ncbi:hypothetical protein C8F01DRAFT_264876 [Mycena amicta]|nr:hypothetical protein C8F01DRAFT_264876 [Mycena amicta]
MRTELVTFQSSTTSRKAKGFYKLKGNRSPIQVNLGAPLFQILQDADSDLDTPSPLSLCFDLTQTNTNTTASSPSPLDDSDSDSESDCDSNDKDEGQVITILSDSPFYTPHPPPTFRTAFVVPPIPAESQVICIPSDSPFYVPPTPPTFKITFDDIPQPPVYEEFLGSTDAFTEVSSELHASEDNTCSTTGQLQHYHHLSSFSDVQDHHSIDVLQPEIRRKPAMLSEHPPASPATAHR